MDEQADHGTHPHPVATTTVVCCAVTGNAARATSGTSPNATAATGELSFATTTSIKATL
jgi:hypothetical protein